MKYVKLPILSNGIISSSEKLKSYYDTPILSVGRDMNNELRGFLSFNIKGLPQKIERVELSMFLNNVSLKGNCHSFMMGIGIALEGINYKELSWDNSPKIYQHDYIYNISKYFQGKYIDFNITSIFSDLISKEVCPPSLSLIGFNVDGVCTFDSPFDSHPPYIKVYSNDRKNPRRPSLKDSPSSSLVKTISKTSFGEFFSLHGSVIRNGGCSTVLFDASSISSGVFLNSTPGEIVIENTGFFRVDYGVNCRVSSSATIFLSLNGIEIPSSKIQIGGNDGFSSGFCIFNCEECNSVLSLVVECFEWVFVGVGNVAKVTVMQLKG